MPFSVFLTTPAARDLEGIYDYIQSHDVSGKGDELLNNLEQIVNSLSQFPRRGIGFGFLQYARIFVKRLKIRLCGCLRITILVSKSAV